MFFLALGTLIKGSIASLNVYVFLLGLVYLAYERRLALLSLSALSFSASLILLWLCAGQNLLDIVPYVRYGIIMALSYVEGMASYVMVQMDLVFVLFNLYVLFVLWREVGLKSIQKLFFFLIVFPFLFVVFKAGFVRDDPIHIMNTLPTLMQFFLILPIVVAFRQGKVLLFSGVMVAFLVFVEASLIATYAWVPRHPAMVSVEGLRVAIDGRGALDEELALAKESIRESYPLPVLSGGSDIYNYRQSLLLASGNRWDPRPIFQGYNTYHPSLLMLNKAHLEDDTKAPTNVFFRVETIGVRHPALDDGVSWPVLLRLYRLEGEFRDHLVFRRLEGANPAQGDGLRLISASGHTLEESLTLPAGDYRAIFARFDFGHSLLGNVTQALFKVTPLFLDYELADGSSRSYAVYPVMVETGLIISPLLESNDDLRRLAMGEPPDPNKRVLSVSVTPYGQALKASRLSKFVGWFWDKEFTMRLYAVEGIALPEGNPSGEPLAGDTGMPAIGP
jgi:hypothetical protein